MAIYEQTTGPDIRPSLLLDFANSKTLDPRITFSRSSTATYYDGKTMAKAEENLWTYSNFNTSWTATNVTQTQNNATAPDGTTTAAKIEGNTSSDVAKRIAHSYPAGTIGNGLNEFTYSVFAKAGTHNIIQVASNLSGFGQFNVDLSNGSSSANGSASGSVSSVGNGWYRIIVNTSYTYASGGSFMIYLIDSLSDGEGAPTTSTGNVYLWGLQQEQRDNATAYTETQSRAITNYIPKLLTAGANVPRFDHDPNTNESKGLLIEMQRTNLEDYSNLSSGWSYGSGAYAPIADVVAPDGSVIGRTYRKKQTNGNGYYRPDTFTGPSNQTDARTFSIYVKKGNWRYVGIRCAGGVMGSGTGGSVHAIFDLDTQTWGSGTPSDYSSTTGGKGYEDVGNGWYRIWVWRKNWNATYEQGQGCYYGVCAAASMTGGAESWDSSSTDVVPTIYFWGAQFEAAELPTSYIPTSGSAVTRSNEQAYITDLSFYNQEEGTIITEIDKDIETGLDTTWQFLNTNDNRMYMQQYTNAPLYVGYNASNQVVFNANLSSEKSAFGYKEDDFVRIIDGDYDNRETDTSGYVPININRLNIGYISNSNVRYLNGWLKRLVYYPKKLSDATLTALTEE